MAEAYPRLADCEKAKIEEMLPWHPALAEACRAAILGRLSSSAGWPPYELFEVAGRVVVENNPALGTSVEGLFESLPVDDTLFVMMFLYKTGAVAAHAERLREVSESGSDPAIRRFSGELLTDVRRPTGG